MKIYQSIILLLIEVLMIPITLISIPHSLVIANIGLICCGLCTLLIVIGAFNAFKNNEKEN